MFSSQNVKFTEFPILRMTKIGKYDTRFKSKTACVVIVEPIP